MLKRYLPAIVLLAALIAFPFALSAITGEPLDKGTPRFWQGLMIQVYILAVFALSYDLLMGYTGLLSFGHALFFGTGAYALGILMKYAHWSLFAALGGVILIVAVESFLIGLLSLRVRGVYFAMVTLAFAATGFILVEATDFREWTGAEDGLHGIPLPDWISPTLHRLEFYYLALAFAVVVYLVARRFVDSPSGRVWQAIRENEPRAVAIGYNTLWFKVQVMVVSGVLAGLAGALGAMFELSVTPQVMDVGVTINALLMTIVGGVGTLIGPMLGAAVLQLLGYVLNTTLGPIWQLAFGIIYILLVLFLPYGIVGTWRRRGTNWRAVWRERVARWTAAGRNVRA
ncbi:MAG: branched-chain amino acid ABC transporter permease [Chloroflexi bacterium]|nr:branched-chain amino acid ABC transporter permease [Chloroflexota bacterium]